MKVISSRIFSVTIVLVISAMFFLNLNGAAGDLDLLSQRDENFNGGSLLSNSGDDGSMDDMKHITASIEDIIISPLIGNRIFPNTPVDFIIETVGPTPEIITLFLDRKEPCFNLTYDLSLGEIILSNDLNGLVEVDKERSSTLYNSTSKRWEIIFNLNFDWSYPKDLPRDVEATMIDIYGSYDMKVIDDAYLFEPDLVISGEPTIKVNDPSAITEDGFIRGGVDALFHQISVHFEGAPSISPDPEDITIGIQDLNGRFWEYAPMTRSHVNQVSFSMDIPRDDGENSFMFIVYQSPAGSMVKGDARFDLIVDSTPPTIADLRYEVKGNDLNLNWAVKENGAGIDPGSIEYSIMHDGDILHPWTSLDISSLRNGRLFIDILDIQEEEIEVRLKMSDRVGNDHPSDDPFSVSMTPKAAHDVSIDGLVINPENVIINQMINFRAMVNNLGTEDEMDVQIEVQRNGEVIEYLEVPELPAGSSREIRWTWKAVEGTTDLNIILDPMGRIDDLDTGDNNIRVIIEPDYLDVKAKEDHLSISDPDAQSMDLITLGFSIRSIGSIESGPIKVTFFQDSKFMGLYQLPSIYKEGSKELVVNWKVDRSVRELTLMIDPYNEILESVEDNNLVTFANPFFEDVEEEIISEEEEGEKEIVDKEPATPSDPGNQDSESGGTIFDGPEIEDVPVTDEGTPVLPVVIQPTPDDPPGLPPFVLPTASFIIGTSFLGFALFGLRSEVLRFKLLGLLIPLYSKLKKNKIEKGLRHEILGYLKAKPGANYSELKHNLDLNDGSLVHHLRILEREEKIYSKKMGKYKLFYVSSYRRQASIRDYISPFQMRIMEIILQNPGIVPKKLSGILDRSQTDMSYHLAELARNGLLQKRKKGRNIHYYIAEEFSDLMY